MGRAGTDSKGQSDTQPVGVQEAAGEARPRLRRIIVDKRREQKEIWNKERVANGMQPYPLPEYDKPFTIKER